jgi:23S rRNA (adenine2503-C2)-methyltransferase
MIKVIKEKGDETLAKVFIAQTRDGSFIEFVESVQPPLSREEKWVLIISTLKGCPVKCPMCDAGGNFRGKLSADEMLAQIAHLVYRRYPGGHVPVPKLKIQFARMGDPAFNSAVPDTLEILPSKFNMPGLLPSVSTVAPAKQAGPFIKRLKEVKEKQYKNGMFQLQFSIHTTSDDKRKQIIPAKTLSLAEISELGEYFFEQGDKKITLNFAPPEGFPIDADVIASIFSPSKFIIKLTPVNPTFAAASNKITGQIDPFDPVKSEQIIKSFTSRGFETILSIGELKENAIGSNCGMYVASLTG